MKSKFLSTIMGKNKLLTAGLLFFCTWVANGGSQQAPRPEGELIAVPSPGSGQWEFDFDLAHVNTGIYILNETGCIVAKPKTSAARAYVLKIYDFEGRLFRSLDKAALRDGVYFYPLPTDLLGYFEIKPDDPHPELVIPAVASRPAGKLTYAVVNVPPEDASEGFTNFSLALDGTALTPGLESHQGLGLHRYFGVNGEGVVREFNWPSCARIVNPNDDFGESFFEVHEKDPDKSKNLHLFPVFDVGSGVPVWESTNPLSGFGYPPKNMDRYSKYLENFVRFAVKRYSYLPFRIYQVSWEPYLTPTWADPYRNDESLIESYKTAYSVITKYDPTAKIAGVTISGCNPAENAHYERLLGKGLNRYINTLSIHPYQWYPPEKPQLSSPSGPLVDIETGVAQLQAINKKYFGKNLPIIGTESGFAGTYYLAANPGVPEKLSELNKATGNVAQAIMAKYAGLSLYTYFYLSDFATEPGYGLTYNLTPVGNSYSFGPSKVSPKMDLPMIRQANDILRSADAVGRWLKPGGYEDVRAYVFKDRKTGVCSLLIWDPFSRGYSLSYKTGSPTVTVMDCFGNESRVSLPDQTLNLSLKRYPTYVQGLSGVALQGLQPPGPMGKW